jgi:hypothetical protein
MGLSNTGFMGISGLSGFLGSMNRTIIIYHQKNFLSKACSLGQDDSVHL